MSSVLVTGSNGFIGMAMCKHLIEKDRLVFGAVRSASVTNKLSERFQQVVIGDLTSPFLPKEVLTKVDCIIHCAARAHIYDKDASAAKKIQAINVDGTVKLAEQAIANGVKRFIFVSSIKANGENTVRNSAFKPDDVAKPMCQYGMSKWQAELALQKIASNSDLELIIVRPPLVYGPGVKGNFLLLLKWLSKGVPFPFGAINNRRSMISIDNLVSLLDKCIDHPASGNTFLVSDDDDLSTTHLLARLGNLLDRPAKLIPVPQAFLSWTLKALGKGDLASRLLGNLEIDISKTKRCLGWTPPVSVDEGLRRAVEWYKREAQ